MEFRYIVIIIFVIINQAQTKLIFNKKFSEAQQNIRSQDILIYEDTYVENTFAGINSFSGYATVQKMYGSALFYWYIPSINKPAQALIVYTAGGPGCSSAIAGISDLINPVQIDPKNNQTYRSANSWADYYNLLFIDQPVGTGYSTRGSGPFTTTTWESAEHFLIAMNNIKKMHPD